LTVTGPGVRIPLSPLAKNIKFKKPPNFNEFGGFFFITI